MTNYTIDKLISDHLEGKQVLPLMTTTSMAERWGKTDDFVYNRFRRDDSFPEPLDGVVIGLKNKQRLFPFYDVVRYEQEKGLSKEGKCESTR